MAEFKLGEENKYGEQTESTKTPYLQLRDDGDKKDVRLMYKNSDDIKGYSVHEVELMGQNGVYKKYVNCLRRYDSPIDDCPLCKANYKSITKLYIPVYDVNEKKAYLWERGKKYFSRLSSICARFPNVAGNIFEISRHGARGSKETYYDMLHIDSDNVTLDELPEAPQPLGTAILEKSASEMNEYLHTGKFPYANQPAQSSTYSSPVPQTQRRTPANTDTEVF